MTNELDSIRGIYRRDADSYDRKTRLVRHIFGIESERRRLLQLAYGDVLDLPAGTGLSFPYYSDDCSVVATDLSTEMLDFARARAEDLEKSIEFQEANAEALPFDDNTFDTVSSMLGLCTYPNPVDAIREMSRVCKKEGVLLFVDHGVSDWAWIADLQNRCNDSFVCKHACHLNRDPLSLIEEAGLRIQEARRRCFGAITSVVARVE